MWSGPMQTLTSGTVSTRHIQPTPPGPGPDSAPPPTGNQRRVSHLSSGSIEKDPGGECLGLLESICLTQSLGSAGSSVLQFPPPSLHHPRHPHDHHDHHDPHQ